MELKTTQKYFEDTLVKIECKKNERFKFVSEFRNIPYLYDATKNELPKMTYLSNTVHRAQTVADLMPQLDDNFDTATEIEAGIFEFTVLYGLSKNVVDDLLSAIYNSKLTDILRHLRLPELCLLDQIESKIVPTQRVAFMSPQELDPKNWENLKKKQQLQEYKKKNMGATDLYKCYKCGERKCHIMQMQTRSADEKMTLFVTCLVCYSTFTK